MLLGSLGVLVALFLGIRGTLHYLQLGTVQCACVVGLEKVPNMGDLVR